MAGENLDLSSNEISTPAAGGLPARRFVGVRFACCDVYARVYINRQQSAYVGHCPRCTKRIDLKIGPGGTDSRFFTVY